MATKEESIHGYAMNLRKRIPYGSSLDFEKIKELAEEIYSYTSKDRQAYKDYIEEEIAKIRGMNLIHGNYVSALGQESEVGFQKYVEKILNDFVDELLSEKVDTMLDNLSFPEGISKSITQSFTYPKLVKYAASVAKIPQENVEIDKIKISSRLANILDHIKNKKLTSRTEFIKEVVKVSSAGTFFTVYNLLAKEFKLFTTPCMIAGVPLYHVQSIEIARSGMILKFRATGAVFLAHQEGGEDGIRIEFMILGEELLLVILLWILYLRGKGYTKSIDTLQNLSGNMTLTQMRETLTNFMKIDESLKEPSYEYHFTYPFVSRHIIIPNTYVETISFEDTLDTGKNVLRCSIFLRTYTPPASFSRIGTNKYGLKDKSDKNINSYKLLQFSVNWIWRVLMASNLLIDNSSYVGSGESTDDDVYYNVNPESLAVTSLLALAGVA